MGLIDGASLVGDAMAYRVFGVTRDKDPWRAADLILAGQLDRDSARAERAWRTASRGYYAEQAGLVAAATLAAHTEDAPLRFSLALAAADEARHADAFYQYAVALGGEPEPSRELFEPLDETLTRLPHMGRALVHTMLEGLAADEFILLREVFAGDPLGEIYHHVRRDEVQHVAIGLTHLARASATPEGREIWRAHAAEWHAAGMEFTFLDGIAAWLGGQTHRDPARVKSWFLRRHARGSRRPGSSCSPTSRRSPGSSCGREVSAHDHQESHHQTDDPRHVQVSRAGQDDQEVTPSSGWGRAPPPVPGRRGPCRCAWLPCRGSRWSRPPCRSGC